MRKADPCAIDLRRCAGAQLPGMMVKLVADGLRVVGMWLSRE